MALFMHILKDKPGEISGKLGLFPVQQGREYSIPSFLAQISNCVVPEQEGIQFGWGSLIKQAAALLPGTAVLMVPIFWRRMCAWLPHGNVPLELLPQHPRGKANPNPKFYHGKERRRGVGSAFVGLCESLLGFSPIL